MSNGALNVNKQVVQKNGTLEITQVIGDSHQLYIFMRFTAPKGTVLNAERYAFDGPKSDFYIDGVHSNYGYGWISIPDENPNDNITDFVMTIHSEMSTMGHKISLDLEDLCAAAPIPDEFKPILTGKWSTSFNLDFKDTSRTYVPAQSVKVHGYDATVESITLSPISIAMKLASANMQGIWDAADQTENEPRFPITILYKDGTSETTVEPVFSTSQGYNAIFFVTPFGKVVNDKEISAVSFFGTVIPIE